MASFEGNFSFHSAGSAYSGLMIISHSITALRFVSYHYMTYLGVR